MRYVEGNSDQLINVPIYQSQIKEFNDLYDTLLKTNFKLTEKQQEVFDTIDQYSVYYGGADS